MDRSVYELIGKIEGVLLGVYMVLKIADTAYWGFVQSPRFGLNLGDFYWGPYGIWLLIAEIGVCGVLPALILLFPAGRRSNRLLFGAFFLDIIGVSINRFVMTIPAIAAPVMPFDKWQVYVPTLYEIAPILAMLAYCVMIISLSYRYLPLFPREKELNQV